MSESIDWAPFFESERPLTPSEQIQLAQIFDASNPASPWSIALTQAGLEPAPELLEWRDGLPGVATAHFVSILSAGYLNTDGKKKILRLPALLSSQWKMDQALAHALDSPPPPTDSEKITQSLFLGIAIQALRLRLPSASEKRFAAWLAGAELPSHSARVTIARILKTQRRRNELAPSWAAAFPNVEHAEFPQESKLHGAESSWQGMPVFAGKVVAPALWVVRDTLRPTERRLLIFPNARPDSVEWFELAAGVAFAQGGVLSHACSIAREVGIVCATGFGRSLMLAGPSLNGKILKLDGGAGILELAE